MRLTKLKHLARRKHRSISINKTFIYLCSLFDLWGLSPSGIGGAQGHSTAVFLFPSRGPGGIDQGYQMLLSLFSPNRPEPEIPLELEEPSDNQTTQFS